MTSPLHQLMYSLYVPHEQGDSETRFILVSSVVNATWNIELGCQGVRDRWWRGSCPLPEETIQADVRSHWSKGIIQVLGWHGATSDTCVLKVVFNLPQTRKLRISLKEYEPEISSTRAMHILSNFNLPLNGRDILSVPIRPLRSISITNIHLREREQTIQELQRKIASLERELESRPPPITPTVTRVVANIPKRRRLLQVKDMRFDGE
ncbi:unnamed protein product [Rhizoctonia solani]|uniref:Uncharacterized protein n=1 Tax=Rhizoctonia solani TaxID=456999 RepID=A0A8H2WBU3_9AGAM|nr:unnamed protein product [Rhizoctonia solani]